MKTMAGRQMFSSKFISRILFGILFAVIFGTIVGFASSKLGGDLVLAFLVGIFVHMGYTYLREIIKGKGCARE